MKFFPRRIVLVTSLIVVLSQTTAYAADKKKPKLLTGASTEMLAYTCAGCHGSNGASMGPSIPTLAGMSPTYFIETMEGYKTGDIPSTIMGRLAKGYSEKEVEQMSVYFSKKTFVAATGQKSDAAKAKKGAKLHDKYCEKCHSEGGTLADDDSGILMGQWKPYLAAQIMDYQSGDRKPTKKMKKKMQQLHKKEGNAGFEALMEYYSK